MTTSKPPGLQPTGDSPTLLRPPSRRRGVTKTTRADDIRRLIADAILAGTLTPGTHLDEQALAAQYGVSRTPIREALRQLAATGLAEMRPHKGVVVTSVTPERMFQMFEVMGELEAACARFAAQRMNAAERRELETIHQESARHVRSGDINLYDAANLDFHAAIYRGSHNEFLMEQTFAVRQRVTPFRRAQFRVLGRLTNSYAEHDQVVQAILRGDADAAFAHMHGHVAVVSDASSDYIAGTHTLPRNGTEG